MFGQTLKKNTLTKLRTNCNLEGESSLEM
jgi:hypothetical protein